MIETSNLKVASPRGARRCFLCYRNTDHENSLSRVLVAWMVVLVLLLAQEIAEVRDYLKRVSRRTSAADAIYRAGDGLGYCTKGQFRANFARLSGRPSKPSRW